MISYLMMISAIRTYKLITSWFLAVVCKVYAARGHYDGPSGGNSLIAPFWWSEVTGRYAELG